MSLKALRSLVAIADYGSFAAAADKLALTQAAVSLQVKALENNYGVTLFDRVGRTLHAGFVGFICCYEVSKLYLWA